MTSLVLEYSSVWQRKPGVAFLLYFTMFDLVSLNRGQTLKIREFVKDCFFFDSTKFSVLCECAPVFPNYFTID